MNYKIGDRLWSSCKSKKERLVGGRPSINKETIDKELIKERSKQWMRIIDGVVDNIEDEDPEEIKNIVKKYKEKLKNFRNCGLEKGGEMSLENLVFKLLRRNGYIEKLYDLPTKIIDKKLIFKLSNKILYIF